MHFVLNMLLLSSSSITVISVKIHCSHGIKSSRTGLDTQLRFTMIAAASTPSLGNTVESVIPVILSCSKLRKILRKIRFADFKIEVKILYTFG
jgi:hypothetical protein